MNTTVSRLGTAYETFLMYTFVTVQTWSPAAFLVVEVVVCFFSVCFFWKTLALYGSPMVAFTSTHTFKAYEAVSSRTKRSCFLQHFTPRHKRLLCQHHGRRHKIPLQILSHPPVSHQGLPVLPYFPST